MARVPQIRPASAISQVAKRPAQTGQGFAALAELSQIAMDVTRPAAIEEAKVDGAKRVYRDDNGQLKVNPANPYGGELGEIENAAAYASYMSQRQMGIRETFAELRTQYEFDPAGFEQAANAYVSTLEEDENVPEVLRQDILASADREASNAFQGISRNNTIRTQRNADRDTAAHRDMLTDDFVNLMMDGSAEEAAKVYAEIENITAYRGTTPFISESEMQGTQFLEGVRGAAKAAQLTRRLEDLEGARSITDEEREEIQALVDDEDLSPRIRQQLYTATQGRLKGIDARALADTLGGTGIGDAVRNYEFGQGVSESYFDAVRTAESGGNDLAQNPRSSATGRYQFTSGTWETMMRQYPELGLTESGRTDPAQQERAMRQFTADNARVLQNNGFTASNGNLYAAHFLGAGDAVRVIGENPASLVSDIVSSSVISANPFLRGMTVGRFNEWAAEKAGSPGRRVRVDTNANRIALSEAGIPTTPGSEFMAGAFSVEAAASLFGDSVDQEAAAVEVLPDAVLDANPLLAEMTVGQAQAWATRRGTVKASDIAARRTQIDQIEDPEVRSIAMSALTDLYNQQRRLEQEAAAGYEARLSASDDTLTEQEITSDHSLSDAQQTAISDELRRSRADQIAVQETLSDLANDEFAWDPYDAKARNRVNDAYSSLIGDQSPLSDEGMAAAGEITMRSGVIPKQAHNAVRAAVASNDPEQLAQAMEFADALVQRQPNAFGPHDGSKAVMDALADYRFYSGIQGAAGAAAQMIENNQPENMARNRNLADQAKEAAKNLAPDDIISHMSELGQDVTMGSDVQQASVMGDYERLFRDAFNDTGNVDQARSRALGQISRVYGPNQVTGDNRLMKFPPQQMYPSVAGREGWMQEQIAADVSQFAFGDFEPAIQRPGFYNVPSIDPDDIMISSDQRTAQDVAANRKPTYSVSYFDDEGMLQSIPGRYEFEPPAPVQQEPAMSRSDFDKQRNMRLWVEHYRSQGVPMNQYNSRIMADMEAHTSAPPPAQ